MWVVHDAPSILTSLVSGCPNDLAEIRLLGPGSLIVALNLVPVYDIPPCFHVSGALGAISEVVGMLPHIQPEDGDEQVLEA